MLTQDRNWTEHLQHLHKRAVADYRKVVFAALKGAGIGEVMIDYEGCNGDGVVTALRYGDDLLNSVGNSVQVPRILQPYAEPSTQTLSLPDAVTELIYNLLQIHQPGWDEERGSYGTFTWDLVRNKLTYTHTIVVEHVVSTQTEIDLGA